MLFTCFPFLLVSALLEMFTGDLLLRTAAATLDGHSSLHDYQSPPSLQLSFLFRFHTCWNHGSRTCPHLLHCGKQSSQCWLDEQFVDSRLLDGLSRQRMATWRTQIHWKLPPRSNSADADGFNGDLIDSRASAAPLSLYYTLLYSSLLYSASLFKTTADELQWQTKGQPINESRTSSGSLRVLEHRRKRLFLYSFWTDSNEKYSSDGERLLNSLHAAQWPHIFCLLIATTATCFQNLAIFVIYPQRLG